MNTNCIKYRTNIHYLKNNNNLRTFKIIVCLNKRLKLKDKVVLCSVQLQYNDLVWN